MITEWPIQPFPVRPCELVLASISPAVVSVHLEMGDFFGFTKSVVSIGARVFHLVLRHVVGVGVERRQFDYFWDRWEVWLDPLVVWTAHGRS